MNRTDCPACGQDLQGVAVVFPSATTRTQIEQTFAVDFKSSWTTVNDRCIWVKQVLLYDCLPYWLEFYPVETWQVYEAWRAHDGTITMGAVINWEDLQTDAPAMFVEEVIRTKRIRMMMQPIVDVAKQRIAGYEMLARGLDAEGGIISPAELYTLAREQNQLFRLDRTCRIAAIEAGTKLPHDMLIFVNFIPTSIYVPEHCLTTTIATVNRLGIDRSRIVFEVVETDRVQDLNHLSGILDYYRSTGFRCALDDFGEGFSDEDTLRALQPDIIKLDRKYVTDIDTDPEKHQMAQTIFEQGRSMGATMLAEGVETRAEAATLARIGYHLQQGYWYGRPAWDPMEVDADKLRVVRDNR